MTTDPGLETLKARVASATLGPEARETGAVTEIADGLAHVSGLSGARLGEVLHFCDGARGFVLNLGERDLQAAFLDPATGIEAGSAVTRTGQLASVPVGKALQGRVVDPMGRPLDDLGPVGASDTALAEGDAPPIIDRDFVTQPVETGLLVIDALFAIGRGQRELIIGERGTGKTSIAVDAILNQKHSDIVCIYVAIGQRTTAVRRVIEAVREKGAFDRTIFVVAPATSEPGLRWLAPFAATSMAEWVRDRGGHALIVYDDLSKHAAVHRELALLSRQPPGREAYPGDIFYLHARLLERSAKLSQARGAGSLTALPIAEIEAGNLSAYIPTNLISISDGQIVTSAALFAGNQRPAVDVGLSVSRVGGKAQAPALRSIAGRLRLDYAQYLEMKMFSRFGGFGDEAMKKRLDRGERIGALLAQERYAPLSTTAQVALLAALTDGALESVALRQFPALKAALGPLVAAEPRLAALRTAPRVDDATRAAAIACVKTAIARLPAAKPGPKPHPEQAPVA
ncbi:F0F1 ATP synthase subunit alpha [Salipiger aestuarii]|uniref:ATP synthase subunit alpha n=1 Tax=Salipiger aestuarii TaxID=568098 RepID=A0A327Y602_9RHOB|nr:F0F1 ATP synthase subunit alpha [Salipiger aestuarii]EIE49002.1 H+-transporting two-sector ATPase, alpha/beta subunit [Citreicella sp. 357]KAA8607523.1 ATP F0F1 synthase subunit alpha [Salipiger aestuarii]KAB2536947.1 ATP F0F1 synthase subunit alpha [Salipiger aestuarii]RAK15175.1 F-type H+-transporting ATPase subunit alpha [Salipiger aestuarii]